MSDKSSTETRRIGAEASPVIVIDAFVADPAAALTQACELSFAPMGPYYPGLRAPYERAEFARLLSPHLSKIQEAFDIQTDLRVDEAAWSLVTVAPSQLTPIQRLPHIDGTDPNRLAVLIYVGGVEIGGTAFYRHRRTGFERVDGVRYEEYARCLEQDVSKNGLPPATYVTSSTALFEKIDHVDARPGRAVIYSGTNLHSGLILEPERLSANPAQGRLTINAFISPAPDEG